MKKRRVISLAVLTGIMIFSLSFAEEKSAEKKSPAETFSGRVIFLDNNSIEIKKGRTEITLNFNDDTVFVDKSGEEKNIDIIKLCQNVKAVYTKEGDKNILQKIKVIKESNCEK